MQNNLNVLVKEVHETAVSKGWWEKPRSIGEILMLIVSEVAEATEEVRAGSPDIYIQHEGSQKHDMSNSPLEHFYVLEKYKNDTQRVPAKPEGEAVELMDAQIRIMDYFGYRGWDLEELLSIGAVEAKDAISEIKYYISTISKLETHLVIVDGIVSAHKSDTTAEIMSCSFATINYVFEHNNWDWQKVYDAKSQYNKSRSYRHGGKTA